MGENQVKSLPLKILPIAIKIVIKKKKKELNNFTVEIKEKQNFSPLSCLWKI